MKLPRDVNGADLVARLAPLGFAQMRQTGSHILVRHERTGETISIPRHRPLKVGTLASIVRDVQELTGLGREELLSKIRG